jgi:hypothetical protein
MGFRKIALAAVLVVGALVLPLLSEPKRPAKAKVDLGAFTREVMQIKLEGNQSQLAMWFPFEFFVEANLAEGGTTRDKVEKDLKFLKPYQTIIVQCSIENDDGEDSYASEKEVRARAVLKLADGTEIRPVKRAPPLVSATVAAMKKMMASEGDAGSANLHVLLFPAKTKDGKPVIDASKKGKLTLVLKGDKRFKETVLVWHTPFDSTNPIPPCPKCKGQLSAKWSFCPWCGQKIDPK